AEDGIRDGHVTGVQTCALPISYLDWSERNLGLNGLATRHHELVQADCREWLDEAARARKQYDLIFLDPPTFSNSKRMEGVLDTRSEERRVGKGGRRGWSWRAVI